MMSAIRQHPCFVVRPEEAEMVFLDFDTIRQCVWPYYIRRQCRRNSDVDLSTEPVGRGLAEAKSFLPNCDFHSWIGPTLFVNASKRYLARPSRDTRRQVLVYPTNPNTWSFGWQEDIKKVKRIWTTDVDQSMIRYVGMDFRKRDTDPKTMINVIPPLLWSYKPRAISPQERQACLPKQFLASFVGRMMSQARLVLKAQHDPAKGIVVRAASVDRDYFDLLLNSSFGFAPTGDTTYSFRTAEVVAAGAVPVFVDDRTVAPWGHTSTDAWAVFLDKTSIKNVSEALGRYSQDDICRMRRAAAKIWGNLYDMRGLVDAMLAALHATVPPPSGE